MSIKSRGEFRYEKETSTKQQRRGFSPQRIQGEEMEKTHPGPLGRTEFLCIRELRATSCGEGGGSKGLKKTGQEGKEGSQGMGKGACP